MKTIADVKRCLFYPIPSINEGDYWVASAASGQTLPGFEDWTTIAIYSPFVGIPELQTFLEIAEEQNEPAELISFIKTLIADKEKSA